MLDTDRDNCIIQIFVRRASNWEYDNTWFGIGTVLGHNPVDTRYADTPVTSCRKRI